MRKILYIFLLCSLSAFCQAPMKIWDKTIGGNGGDNANSIIATSDGGFLIAGSSSSGISGDKSEINKGNTDFWIVKMNNQGQKVWDKTLGGTGFDFAYSIIESSDGSIMIAGSSGSNPSGDKTEMKRGGDDFWIIKLNSSGQKNWDKTIGGDNSDFASAIVESADGGFVIAGRSFSGISGEKSEANQSDFDYWVVKIDTSGNKIWDKTLGGNSTDYATSIITTQDGGFLIGGFSASNISGDKSEARRGAEDFWIVKLNSGGQKVWDKTFGGNGVDIPYSIAVTSDGNFVVAGNSYSNISGDKSETYRGFDDYWIVKFNNLGLKVWDKTLGGSNQDFATSIISTTDGNIVVAGHSLSGISGEKTEIGKGNNDFWVVKLNILGQVIWDKTIGGNLDDLAKQIVETADGSFLLGGYSLSGISGDKSEASQGNTDYWIIKLGGQFFESITTGNWNVGSTWISPSNTLLPTATKTAKINSTHTVTIPNAGNEVKTIQMNGGVINLNGGTLEIKNQ